MRIRSITWIVALSFVLVPGLALAGDGYGKDEKSSAMRTTNAKQDFQPRLERAEALIGHEVRNADGKELGSVVDLVTDPRRRGIGYAVLEYGGFLGMGEDLHAIPWNAFQVRETDDGIAVILDATEEQLQSAEGFDDDHWPNAGNAAWVESVHASYYGDTEPREMDAEASWNQATEAWTEQAREQEIRSRRLSRILGREVANPQNDDVGEVADLLVDVNEGHLAYVIVDLEDELFDLYTDRAAVPWHATQVRGEKVFVDATRTEIVALAFAEGDVERLEDRTQAMLRHRRVMTDPYWIVSVWVPETSDARSAMARDVLIGTVASIERQDGETRLDVKTRDGRTVRVDAGDLNRDAFGEGDDVVVIGRQASSGTENAMVAHAISTGDLMRIDDPDTPEDWSTAMRGSR